ncbi:MAG: CidA/LrgA family protein [Lawsonibacter sp.]|nr:CidA/LrgA family protein [Lawsonibacter sp.]
MAELAIVFGICLVSEGIVAFLPFSFPASVISMLLLLALLMSGLIKQRHIDRVCHFFVGNMAFFFIAPCVGLIEHVDTLLSALVPFLIVCVFTTPLVYFVTAWVIQLMMATRRGKGAACD